MTRKDSKIEQVDGASDLEGIKNDEKYEETLHYWQLYLVLSI